MLKQHLALMEFILSLKSTSWAMKDLHRKTETLQGGYPLGNKVSKVGQAMLKKPTATQHTGYQPSTTQWGAWPHNHSVVKPGRPLL